jgi:hypothetical protein
VCELTGRPPAAFASQESFREDYDDHIGIRLGFRDPDGRELHLFAGIPGEIGEGLPEAGSVTLADGGSGSLIGEQQVWVVRWDEGDVCDPRAVLANGFTREEFLDVLADSGIAPPGA